MQSSYDSGKRSLLSLICHGFTLAGVSVITIFAPIVVLMISDDPVVKANAKESINFHLNIWFWASVIGGIYGVLSFLTFGILGILLFPMIAFGFLWHFGWSIVAIVKTLANPDEPFRYPFIFRVL
ncbi:DUF4870 domain-containing protein [Alkalinema pantanalense CENA528]|uniref:DUF4870 domain-containing protein n=1 Tax=Alkalinema pantanalense TaxID=1620705 RepID=UPI003D6F4947